MFLLTKHKVDGFDVGMTLTHEPGRTWHLATSLGKILILLEFGRSAVSYDHPADWDSGAVVLIDR